MSANSPAMTKPQSLKKAIWATYVSFLVAGMALASWAPLVPFLKTRAHLNDNDLGLLLMCLGLGSIIAMPLGGFIAEKRGCLIPIALCSFLLCISLPVLATTSSIALIAVMLFLFGAGLGGLDCVMNIHGLIVEKRSSQLLMPIFHAMFSLGSLVGVLFVTLSLSFGLTSSVVGLIVGIIMACIFLPFLTSILSDKTVLDDTTKHQKMWVFPRGLIVILAFICFTAFLSEGVVLDWSALFTIEKWGIDPKYGGFAFFVFASSMMVTRLSGKFLVEKYGNRHVAAIGGLFAVVGVLTIIFSSHIGLGLLGYAVAGAGVANIAPIAFSAVADQDIVPHSTAISMISLCGYSGTLMGPGIMGVVAHHTSLTVSFLLLSFILAIMTLLCYRLSGKR